MGSTSIHSPAQSKANTGPAKTMRMDWIWWNAHMRRSGAIVDKTPTAIKFLPSTDQKVFTFRSRQSSPTLSTSTHPACRRQEKKESEAGQKSPGRGMEADGIEHDGSTAAGGGPAPFLLKTYEMVDDASTDDIVSWSPSMKSFVVWNHADFAASLLPTYFKHNNFSSFIRQLNTYGFRKIDPERWEFANEDFLKGHKHLLKNIRRRKPIHSHSLPPGGGLADAERTALEEEIDRLKREKDNLQATLWRFEQQNSGTENQLDDVERRLADMEQRQLKMIAFLQRAMLNPRIVENLVKMANSSSMDFSVIHKKRRLPPAMDFCQETSENNLGGEHCSTSRLELGHVLNQDFCDKLKLGLCSAFPDRGLAVASTESSNGGSGCSLGRQIDCDHSVMECLPLAPETLELCDTGASICPTKNLSVTREVDDDDGIFPCHLSLTLASSAMQIDRNECSSMTGNSIDLREANSMELDKVVATRENELSMLGLNNQRPAVDSNDTKVVPVQEAPVTSKEAPAVPPVRVNDLFWEQFLTERPGSSDTEEVSSSSRAYARNA